MTDTTSEAPVGRQRRSIAYKRDKRTRRSVILADKVADRTITIGGLLVIAAVFTIMFFLISVCLPLLDAGEVRGRVAFPVTAGEHPYVSSRVDEEKSIAVELARDGAVTAFHAGTGAALATAPLDLGGQVATAFARTLLGDDVLFGFPDGTVRLGVSTFRTQILPAAALPQGLTQLDSRDSTDGAAVYSKLPTGQIRKTTVELTLEAPVQLAPAGTAIVHADYRVGGTAERPVRTFVTVDADGVVRQSFSKSIVNMMTGERTTEIVNAEVPSGVPASDIVGVLLNTQGDRLLVGTREGNLRRFSTRDVANPALIETVRVTPEGVDLTALAYLNAENSVVVGRADGSVSVWFGVPRANAGTADGMTLTEVHVFDPQPAPVRHIAASQRTRMFITGDDAGQVWLRHATTSRTLLTLADGPDMSGLQSMVLTPKDDGVVAIGRNGQAVVWEIFVPHPETTLQSLFGKIWYEGHAEPSYVWQSTAMTDAAEPKISLIPLIFGTLKAAIYSLLFAVPISLLGAVYTSEFLHYRVRAVVKPVMEVMASLPSVVVGFVAALVMSPIVETWIAAVIIAFGVIPLTLIGMAFLWQALPNRVQVLLDGVPKLLMYFAAIALAVWITVRLGPVMEQNFFGGDFKRWTSGVGPAQPFVFLLITPLAIAAVFVLSRPLFSGAWRDWLRGMSFPAAGAVEFVRWAVMMAGTFGLAWAFSFLLSDLGGYDPRGGIVDTYVQRNTLVAAFAIGFAEIPIIYTIAEDALNAVPEHLRAASLGCGATRWQTSRWVVMPTAGSGIFSAIMIGLGRAVGETMIVVMSTGNTPVLDINIFNGLRALSANINVELPEAVRDSTLYRTLFLCGLTLFVMTFVVNTIAEVVRQRFRKRAAQL